MSIRLPRRQVLIAAASTAAGTGLWPLSGFAATAAVGQAAPDFKLADTAGRTRSLSEWRGRPVVLEWNNPGCPFVRKHYQGNMQALQKEAAAQGVAWLAINSTETGSADYMTPPQLARWMQDKQAAPAATLMDEDGTVGRLYAARVTPHMYVIDARGVLVYAGGIDNIASARAEDIPRATNHVRAALADLKAGRPVAQAMTSAYGCSIKYKV